MNIFFNIFLFVSVFMCVSGVFFDRYSGNKLDDAAEKEIRAKNLTEKCTIDIKPCTLHEGSRVDGGCNNIKRPSAGSAKGPYLRLLTPDYGNDKKYIRTSKKGSPLPSARKVRTRLQTDGRVEDKHMFTVAAPHFLEFIAKDVSVLNGPRDYLYERQHCCTPQGEKDRRCIPIMVPEDDPYLRVTDIRCLNFSRAETFQDAGCSSEIIPAEQINYQTPLIDLSTIYGVDDKALEIVREFKHGLLKLPGNDNEVPLNVSVSSNATATLQNATDNLFTKQESKISIEDKNASSGDICLQKELNITDCYKFGYENMMQYNLISDKVKRLRAYFEEEVPLVYTEYEIATRFFHNQLDGRIKRYNENLYYVGEFPLSETLYRQDISKENRNLKEINRGTFHQNAARIDDIQDPEISEKFYGKLQRAHDLAAIDIQRGRDLGVRGYNDYRHLCGLKPAKKFEDLSDVMDLEKIQALKELYDDVEDIDLLAGIMSENLIKGAYVGPTLFCIMAKQILLWRFSDRFWFERGHQFHSFSVAQLHEIRRTNIARLACDNAEAIEFIQPRAFLHVGHGNSPLPCSHIQGPDLTKWEDHNCRKSDERIQEGNKKQEPLNMVIDYSSFFNSLLSFQ